MTRVCQRFQPAWWLVFLLGMGSGWYLSGLQAGEQNLALRQQLAAWRVDHAGWATERLALQAELEQSRDALVIAQAWIDRLHHTLTISHARMADTQSSLDVCERLLDTLFDRRRR